MKNGRIVEIALCLAIVFFVFENVTLKAQEIEFQSEKLELNDTIDIKYELIMYTSSGYRKAIQPNAALLISDKEAIKMDAELFLAAKERTMGHLCGYHYSFMFWKDTDSLLSEIAFNKNCEEFTYKPEETSARLAYYGKKLETEPTHFIYNVEIPVSMEPNEVREKLKSTGFKLFFIDDGEMKRFPSVLFAGWNYMFAENIEDYNIRRKAYEENEVIFREKFKEIANKTKSIASIVGEPNFFSSTVGSTTDSVYLRGYLEIKYEIGTNVSKVKRILKQTGVEINRIESPKTYIVQIVDTLPNIEHIKDKLKQFNFVKKVTEYGVIHKIIIR